MWQTAEPGELAVRLRRLLGPSRREVSPSPPPSGTRWVDSPAPARLIILAGPEDALDLSDAASDAAEVPAHDIAVLALGWGTVDLDRWRPVRRVGEDGLLGATVAVPDSAPDSPGPGSRRWALPPGLPVVVLEPATEGRLAAALARRGEGPAVLYLAADPGLRVDRADFGPFGREVLAAGSRFGPFLIACEQPVGGVLGTRTIRP